MKFGAVFLDYDLDGRPDLLTCNGHLEPDIADVAAGPDVPAAGAALLEHRRAGRLFEPVVGGERRAGPVPAARRPRVCVPRLRRRRRPGRGADREQRPGPAAAQRQPHREHLATARCSAGRTAAIGAEVTVEAGGVTRRWYVAGARGYLSQSESVVTVGLGRAAKADRGDGAMAWQRGRHPDVD